MDDRATPADTNVGPENTRSRGGDLSGGLRALAEWLAPTLHAVQHALEVHGPALVKWAEDMKQAHDILRHWEAHAPIVLKEAIADAGLIVPVSQMSFADMIELLRLCHERGSAPAVQWVAAHYDRVFSDPEFLGRVESAWVEDPHLARRMPVLRDALRAHAAGLYGASVPTLIAQFEGYVADLRGHQGTMNFPVLQGYVAELAAGELWTDVLIQSFVGETLLAKFAHGAAVPPFSRHAILHGGDVAYGTEQNSRTAVLLIDYLCMVARWPEREDDPSSGP